MADIIKFPPLKQTRDLPASTGTPTTRPEIRGASQQELLAQGGEALAQLGAWKSRGIPDQDRIAMARNMDALLNELCIKPKDLPWQSRYGDDREAFNRDLSRMRLPAYAAPGRRLMAFNTRWIDLLKMLSEACEARGDNLTLYGLAERLTRGTRFHPVKRAQTIEEKQLYKLKLWANNVGEQTGLLRTFKNLSALRAEHFRLHLRGCDDTQVSADALRAEHLLPSSFFTNIPEDVGALFDRELGSYTEDDWALFYQHIPEELTYQFSMYQHEIENWHANTDPARALFVKEHGDYLPLYDWIWSDLKYLPRCYLGRVDFDRKRLLEYYEQRNFPNGTGDPLLVGDAEDHGGSCYLVLYPSPELNRLIPHLLHCDGEMSFCVPLTEEILRDDTWPYFPADTPGTQCVSTPLLVRIEETHKGIHTAWCNSANDLTHHPYFAWEADRTARIDEELARMTAPSRQRSNSEEGA